MPHCALLTPCTVKLGRVMGRVGACYPLPGSNVTRSIAAPTRAATARCSVNCRRKPHAQALRLARSNAPPRAHTPCRSAQHYVPSHPFTSLTCPLPSQTCPPVSAPRAPCPILFGSAAQWAVATLVLGQPHQIRCHLRAPHRLLEEPCQTFLEGQAPQAKYDSYLQRML